MINTGGPSSQPPRVCLKTGPTLRISQPAMSDTSTGMMEQGAANEVNTLGRLEGDQLNALLGQPPHVHNEVPLPSMRGKAREDTRKRGRTCRSLAPHLRRCCRDWSRNQVYP